MPRPDKRAAVMQAALEIIAAQGFHDSPTAHIAERAGVGMGTIYRYFKSKDELIHAIFKERIAVARGFILEKYDRSQSLQRRFLFLSNRLYNFMLENPLDFKFFEQYRNSPYGSQVQFENIQAFEKDITFGDYPFMTIFKEGQDLGVVKELNLPLLLALTLSPIFTLIGQVLSGDLVVQGRDVDSFFRACWDAIAC